MSDWDEFVLRNWANRQTVKRLRKIAAGMPYLHEVKKAEIVDWLMEHHPENLQREWDKEAS